MDPARPLLAALALLLAGCVAAPPPGPGPGAPPSLEPVGEPIVQDHDHSDASLHEGFANLARIGSHSGYGSGATSELPEGQGFSELAVWQGERDGKDMTLVFLGRRDGPDGGFVILDASVPRNITPLGQYPGQANYDVEVTEDGLYAFFTTQFLPWQGQSPTGIDPEHDQRAVYVVDLADLAQPRAVFAFYPPSRGAHTVHYHKTDQGRELLVVNTYDFLPDPSLGLPVPSLGGNPAAHRVLITEFLREPARLQVLSVFEKSAEVAPLGQSYFPHDAFVQEHPLTGQLLLYVAYWDLGGYIVDITDPAQPREVSRLTDFAPSKHASVHFLRPAPELVEGVHVTITEPELGPTDETGQYTLFDTTDPASPKRLGYWELPGDIVITEGLLFSPHNFDIANGRVYLAHYHGGVWVFDIHERALLDRPATLAYYQVGVPRDGHGGYAPNFWSAFYKGGHVWASDMSAGLHVLRFALDRAG